MEKTVIEIDKLLYTKLQNIKDNITEGMYYTICNLYKTYYNSTEGSYLSIGDYSIQIDNIESLKEYLNKRGVEIPSNIEDIYNWKYLDSLEDLVPDLEITSYDIVETYEGFFLTKEGAENHLYKYGAYFNEDAKVVTRRLWQNEEMDFIIKLIKEI